MKNKEKKNNFFGFSKKDKVKIVKEAARAANKEQFELVERQGGIRALRNFSK